MKMRRTTDRRGVGRMCGIFLLALTAAASIPRLTSPSAMPLRNNSEMVSGFLRTLDGHDPASFGGAGTASLPDNPASYDTTALPADAFEHAASRGLASFAINKRALSLANLIAIAGLDTGLYSPSTDEAETSAVFGAETPGSTDGAGIAVRNVAHVLVNRVEAPDGNNGGGRGALASGGEYSLLNIVMETQLNTEFIEAASKIVTPTVTTDGVIALTFLGLRDFAFIASPVANKMRVMDFQTGTTITLSHHADNARVPLHQRAIASTQDQSGPPRVTVHDLLTEVKQFFFGYVLHPFTLASLALFSVFWLLLRIARRAS